MKNVRLMLIQKNMNKPRSTYIFGDEVTKLLINVKRATMNILMMKYLVTVNTNIDRS